MKNLILKLIPTAEAALGAISHIAYDPAGNLMEAVWKVSGDRKRYSNVTAERIVALGITTRSAVLAVGLKQVRTDVGMPTLIEGDGLEGDNARIVEMPLADLPSTVLDFRAALLLSSVDMTALRQRSECATFG
jgi:hypothetical protein